MEDICFYDHFLVTVDTSIERPRHVKITTLKRDTKNINLKDFKADITISLSETKLTIFEEFDRCLHGVFDDHAPLQQRVINSRHVERWMTLRIKEAKQDKRKAERYWKRTGLTVHKQMYKVQKRKTIDIVKEDKKKYISTTG